MNKKIVFFDIDGTLYLPDIGVPDSAKEAIGQLLDNGHIPIICTGRTRPIVPDNLIELGFKGIIAGAGTYVEYEGKIIENKVVEDSLVTEIMAFLQENKVRYILEGPECLYYEEKDKGEEYNYIVSLFKYFGEEKIKALDSDMDICINKMSCTLSEESNRDIVMPKLEEKFHPIYHGIQMFELVPRGINKATGIQRLLEHINMDQKDTYAFGDSSNDIEMLEYVATGIAMGNSYPEVLERIKHKTKSIKEDGIYHGLKKFNLI
ncbi:Cof-type HAD-IIB family hydrolase [Anaerocolumna sp.]|uniref:Cof-type HAD-IIB family hydrolase n=1 Tax=Anaerocolumna sp. TaxID=2041569 RepID=UPI0028AB10B8|nr:Cof-type HAD-IIB family hydrolase [Anaerocolumna sp.]